MLVDYVIYGLLSILSALASFYLTNNIYFLLITFIVFLGYFVFFELHFKRKERKQYSRNKDLNIFIHDFFIDYSVKPNLTNAINSASQNVSNHLKEEIKLLEEFSPSEKLDHLSKYFSSSLYQLFIKTIYLCEDRHDDVMKTAGFLLEENEQAILSQKKMNRNLWRSLCEFSLLWAVSFIILIMIRFAINNYFIVISQTWFYQLGVGCYFLFFLISIHLFLFASHGSVKRYEQ